MQVLHRVFEDKWGILQCVIVEGYYRPKLREALIGDVVANVEIAREGAFEHGVGDIYKAEIVGGVEIWGMQEF